MKVFISYKWEDASQNAWVEKFATDLRKAGIESHLDQWEVRYGDSFIEYMTSMIGKADVVLFIITTASVAAVESSKEVGGVKFELQLTLGRLIGNEKIRLIPVFREGEKIAIHLKDRRYIDFRDDTKYESNLQNLVEDILDIKQVPPVEPTDDFDKSILSTTQQQRNQILSDPFSFLNAEVIDSPRLLRDLCSLELGYFGKITSLNYKRVVVSGPRGSGKTTILKYMRFITQFDEHNLYDRRLVDQIKYIGLYLSVRSQFRNILITKKQPKWVSQTSEIIFYSNTLFVLELLMVLDRLASNNLERNANIRSLVKFLSEAFHLSQETPEALRHELIDLVRSLISDKELHHKNIDKFNSSHTFINEINVAVQSLLPSLKGKPLILLVDDLSFPIISDKIMDAICRILFCDGSTYHTRVSAHSGGLPFVRELKSGYTFEQDIIEINLGKYFITSPSDFQIHLNDINDILARRFLLSGKKEFIGICEMLSTGIEPYNFAKEMLSLSDQKKLRTLKYYGCNILIHLFSGDLSYLIDVLRIIYEANDGKKYPVDINLQNQVIRNYSRKMISFLKEVKTDVIPSLYDVCYFFGFFAKHRLFSKSEEFLSLEVEIEGGSVMQDAAIRELLTYGVFVDGGLNNTSSGKLSRKLIFRKIYTPAFPVSFRNRSSLKMDSKSFEHFIHDPKGYTYSLISREGDIPDLYA